MTRWIDRENHRHNSHDVPFKRRSYHVVNRSGHVAPTAPVEAKVDNPAPIEELAVALTPSPVELTLQPAKPKKQSRKKTHALSLILLAGVVAGGLWFTSRGGESASPEVLAAQTVEEVAAITSDEKPIILYVTDKTKVQQEFLAKAENGDEVWLYYQAKKAVLYRPSSDEVVSIGEFVPPPAKVFIRNGTTGSGQLSTIEGKLKTLPKYNIVSKDRSSSTKYAETVVVDVSGRYTADAEELARNLGALLGEMPKGETRPDADILVIVGAR